MGKKPFSNYYFRIRETGALVFRIDTENRSRRVEMHPIAVVNMRNGNIKPQGNYELTDEDRAAIEAWIEDRKPVLEARERDRVDQTIDHINLTAQWAQSKASDEELEEMTNALLMAIHDLRTVLVRKMSERQ